MTEQEAIKEIKRWTCILMNAGSECINATADAQVMAISSLEEIQRYREAGTIDECKEARKRQIPVKPLKSPHAKGSMYRICGACGKAHDLTRGKYHYCYNCGTKVDWSEE